jgi:cell fate (sporulation/competence/biofilm development) regulator YlbF (YheA/YmcA/DUF963 family)
VVQLQVGGIRMKSLDMYELIDAAHQLADHINQSNEVISYLGLKKTLESDKEAQLLLVAFGKVKEDFEETKRFGIFHPNYHEAKEKMEHSQEQLRTHPIIGEYLQAEQAVEQLLYQVSVQVANSVSETIKVPNELMQKRIRSK